MMFSSATEYENYQSTSKNYDDTRTPVGLNVLLGTFAQHSRKPLANQRLLDAGCGTGSFLDSMAEKFRTATGLDANAGMLGKARTKLSAVSNVTLSQSRLPELPFPDNSFDAIMLNQVVHHLDVNADFLSLEQLTTETFRVLAPGGSVVINTSSKEQVCNSFWFGWVIPEAKQRMASRYAPTPMIQAMLEKAGFEDLDVTVPLDAMYDMNVYLDQKGPFQAAWRACDSMFALATEEELEMGLERLQTACDDGSVEKIIEDAEQWRLQAGQSTFFSVRKR